MTTGKRHDMSAVELVTAAAERWKQASEDIKTAEKAQDKAREEFLEVVRQHGLEYLGLRDGQEIIRSTFTVGGFCHPQDETLVVCGAQGCCSDYGKPSIEVVPVARRIGKTKNGHMWPKFPVSGKWRRPDPRDLRALFKLV
jgi:hypothetical protein